MSLKGILFAALVTFSIQSFAGNHPIIKSYSDLANVLAQGNNVKAIIDFSKCQPQSDVMGSMNFTPFNKYFIAGESAPKETIATSTTVFTHTNKFGHVYNYVRLRVFADDSAEIFSEFIDPKTYVQITSTAANCKLNNGITLYQVG